MINSSIHTIKYPNGEIQRVQKLCFESWRDIDFFKPQPSKDSLDRICDLYENYIIPKAPHVFGTLVFFLLPDDITVPFKMNGGFGTTDNRQIAAAAGLRKYAGCGSFNVTDMGAAEFVRKLQSRGLLRIVRGKRKETRIMPVSSDFGFLSSGKEHAVKTNSSFFIMDMFDLGSVYDVIGTPIGLQAKNGEVFSPPLYGREALIVRKNGSVSVEIPTLRKLAFYIYGMEFLPDKNCRVFERSERRKTPKSKHTELVIIGNTVAAVKSGGKTEIPSSGFVLRISEAAAKDIEPGAAVVYRGAEDVEFAVQIGNSTIINGVKTPGFISPFSNIYKPLSINTPPSLYPLDYKKARAPRMVIGADKENRPMILWLEGAGKNGYTPGADSCGASLSETAEICEKLGLFNAVNMDGGGSAQILLNGQRGLRVSDRKKDGSEAERPIPIGLYIS